MNEARDLQHPDITAAEKTGYPHFPHPVQFEISEELAKEFCFDAFSLFWDFLSVESPQAITSFLDEYPLEFCDFLREGG